MSDFVPFAIQDNRFQSSSTGMIAAALAKAQSGFTFAAKDRKGYGYKYADLQGILDAVRKGLTENGIAVSQQMVPAEGGFTLRTVLFHESGEWIASELPIHQSLWLAGEKGKPAMQNMGSCITYARRYALSAIAGIAPDEDNDAATLPGCGPKKDGKQEQKDGRQDAQEAAPVRQDAQEAAPRRNDAPQRFRNAPQDGEQQFREAPARQDQTSSFRNAPKEEAPPRQEPRQPEQQRREIPAFPQSVDEMDEIPWADEEFPQARQAPAGISQAPARREAPAAARRATQEEAPAVREATAMKKAPASISQPPANAPGNAQDRQREAPRPSQRDAQHQQARAVSYSERASRTVEQARLSEKSRPPRHPEDYLLPNEREALRKWCRKMGRGSDKDCLDLVASLLERGRPFEDFDDVTYTDLSNLRALLREKGYIPVPGE